MTPATAGELVAAGAGPGAPASLVIPPFAARRPSQARWVLAASAASAAGIVGWLVAPGAAQRCRPFCTASEQAPVAMIIVLERTRDVSQTGRLSAAARSGGYLLAATGPHHRRTGGGY